jgi:hypothetical protein
MDMVRMPEGSVRRHPLRFWHYHLAHEYDGRAIRRMHGSLAKTDLPSETRCRDAATGDPAAGIGIALGMRDAARVVMRRSGLAAGWWRSGNPHRRFLAGWRGAS